MTTTPTLQTESGAPIFGSLFGPVTDEQLLTDGAETEFGNDPRGGLQIFDPDADETVSIKITGASLSGAGAGLATENELIAAARFVNAEDGSDVIVKAGQTTGAVKFVFDGFADGRFFALDQNTSTSLSYTFEVTDSAGNTTSNTISMRIFGEDTPAIVSDVFVEMDEDTTFSGQIDGLDPEGDPLNFRLLTDPTVIPGVVDLDPDTGAFTFTPDENFNGEVELFYATGSTDGSVRGSGASIFITVSEVNDAPVIIIPEAATIDASVSEGTVVTDVDTDLVDLDDTEIFEIVGGNDAGGYAIDADTGEITVIDQLAVIRTGSTELEVAVTDGAGLTASTTVDVTVELPTSVIESNKKVACGTDDADLILAGDGRNFIFAKHGDDLVLAGAGSDKVFAGDGDDEIWGQEGRDVIFGGDGSDTIDGGANNDYLRGGEGADTFVFTDAFGLDRVFDFNVDEDAIRLDDGVDFALFNRRFGVDLVVDGAGTARIYGATSDEIVTAIERGLPEEPTVETEFDPAQGLVI